MGGERSRIGSRSSWGEGDRDQSTLYERTNKNEEEKVVRNEQEMYPGEKPLMGPGGNTGNCLPLTHKGLHSHSLLVQIDGNNGCGSLAGASLTTVAGLHSNEGLCQSQPFAGSPSDLGRNGCRVTQSAQRLMAGCWSGRG